MPTKFKVYVQLYFFRKDLILSKEKNIGIFTFMIYFLKFETFSVSLDSMSVALRCALFFNMERIFTVSLCQIEQYAYLVCMQKAFRLQINNRKVLKKQLIDG